MLSLIPTDVGRHIGDFKLKINLPGLEPLVQQVQRDARESGAIIHWNSDDGEMVNGFPLTGDNNQLLGILLVGSSRQIYAELRGQIRSAALLAAAAGLLLAVLLSSWAAARVTKPVEELAHAAHEIAGGNWNARVTVNSNDEIGELLEERRLAAEAEIERLSADRYKYGDGKPPKPN